MDRVGITINGRPHTVIGRYLTYAELVRLADMTGTPSMTWRLRGTNEGGIVSSAGGRAVVLMRDGLVINVAHTGAG